MSKQSNLGRPWTPYEDALLKAAVGIHGDNTEKWKTIALSVPGRTNKACRKRWLHSLSPSVKKSAWTADEDQLLVSLFEKHPNKWSQIAREIPGRTDDACSKRYREALDPSLKKDEWTEEEERLLLDALGRHGGATNPKWGLIGQELRRSGLGCRNRWRLLERKRNAAARQGTVSQTQTSNENVLPQLLADVWPLFAEDESSSYWTTAWDSVGVGLSGLGQSQTEPGLTMVSVGGERPEEPPVDSTTAHSGLFGSHVGIAQNAGKDKAAEGTPPSLVPHARTFSYTSLSPREARPEQQTIRSMEGTALTVPPPIGRELSSYSPSTPVTDAVDYGPSQGDDSFHLNDDYTQDCPLNDNNGSERALNEASYVSEVSSDVQRATTLATNETANLCSLGTLAHAASTLSPSPCTVPGPRQVQHVVHDLVVPPRKRRRTAADSPASTGMRVISNLVGKQKAEPKLSSSLPVAGDPSIFAYVCGHSACLPLGAVASTECFSTSGELLSHFKERHINNVGDNEETPFRCGLGGCKKGWKSINGLQYHLQISKIHYQHVCSHAAATEKQTTGIDPRTDVADANPPDPSRDVPRSRVAKRLHKCPRPGCVKEYKQLSGLRYHLLHGHPRDLPAQLDTVPPMIARQFSRGSETETTRAGAAPP